MYRVSDTDTRIRIGYVIRGHVEVSGLQRLQLWAGWGFDEVGGSEGKGGCGRCKCNVDGEPR